MADGLLSRMERWLPWLAAFAPGQICECPRPLPKPSQGQVGWQSQLCKRQKLTEAFSSVKVVEGRFQGISGKARAGRPSGPGENLKKD